MNSDCFITSGNNNTQTPHHSHYFELIILSKNYSWLREWISQFFSLIFYLNSITNQELSYTISFEIGVLYLFSCWYYFDT